MNESPSAPVSVSFSGIEVQPAGDRERRHDLRAREEIHRGAAPVVAAGEVAVVRGDDCVGLIRRGIRPAPLADTWPAGVGEHCRTDVLEGLQLAVPLDGRAHLLGARGDEVRHSGFQPAGVRLPGHIGRAAHVLVGGVGATADQGRREIVRKAGFAVGDLRGKARERAHAVGRERAGDVRLQGGEVEPQHAVVVGFRRLLDLACRAPGDACGAR